MSFITSLRNNIVKRVVKDEVQHTGEKIKHLYQIITNKEPRENTNLNDKIDFARLSMSSYGKTQKEREVEGFDILPEHTSPDRTTYFHRDTGKVIIAFRGTDPHDWSGGVNSRGFRDLTTDAILAGGEQDRSRRFQNSENATAKLIKQFGRSNVIATGHSLGGSQALHVSNKFGIHAEVYNPHIDWESSITRANYYNAALHVNRTDPVAAFYPGATFQSVDERYNKKAKPFLGQHGIENFFLNKPSTTQPKSDSNRVSSMSTRPSLTTTKTSQESNNVHHAQNVDCSRMPRYMQIQYGCPPSWRRVSTQA